MVGVLGNSTNILNLKLGYAIAIAINVEAARRDVTVCALLLDALRRTFPAVALVIEQEAKKSAA